MQANRRNRGRALPWVLLILLLVAIIAGVWYLRKPSARPAAPGGAAQVQGVIYTCPMHPQIRQKGPGQCPICGMTLVPVEPGATTAAQAMPTSSVPGQGVIQIDPRQRQLIGVVTTPVTRRKLDRAVRTVGDVTIDESRTYEVHTKVDGWVERLYTNQTGKIVRQGQPMLTIYSPDLVSTQEEYLVALRSQQRLANSPFPEVRKSGASMLAAARERLRLWDVPDSDIRRLETTGQVRKTLTISAPATGYIMEKMVTEGTMVTPAMTLLKLADLSRVWVEASVYEYELPTIAVAQRAKLTLQAHPGTAFWGRVNYVYPTVESMTRSVKARLEFANPRLALKPGMYGDVEILVPTSDQLAIPEQALLDTGARKLVFVEQTEGIYVPREVTLGPRAEGYYPVLSGLREGELVVSSPNFLLDSESKLRAMTQGGSMAGMTHEAKPEAAKPATRSAHTGHGG
jgi:RND family efflux transporter MFP subunit